MHPLDRTLLINHTHPTTPSALNAPDPPTAPGYFDSNPMDPITNCPNDYCSKKCEARHFAGDALFNMARMCKVFHGQLPTFVDSEGDPIVITVARWEKVGESRNHHLGHISCENGTTLDRTSYDKLMKACIDLLQDPTFDRFDRANAIRSTRDEALEEIDRIDKESLSEKALDLKVQEIMAKVDNQTTRLEIALTDSRTAVVDEVRAVADSYRHDVAVITATHRDVLSRVHDTKPRVATFYNVSLLLVIGLLAMMLASTGIQVPLLWRARHQNWGNPSIIIHNRCP
eukprot:m.398860 g.398860  ORF g.398860 m.398860 type:complete len:286 (+) comp16778_c0_seq44:767-1624(+)